MKCTEYDYYMRPAICLGRCRFKGGGSSTTVQQRNIPAQTGNEAALEGQLMPYAQSGLSSATNMLNKANSSLDSVPTVDWNSMLDNYNKSMADVTSGYTDLANGELPSVYAAARQKALNSDLTGTVGSAISSLANRGIVNSSITNSALDNISQDASNTLAKNYTADLETESGLLNSRANAASNIIANNATAQAASYVPASTLYGYASQLATPAQNMYNTMYSGRMGSGSTTTSQSGNDGGASTWGIAGSLGSAAIMCFTADTLVTTPNGYKSIKDITVGDEVLSIESGDIVTKKVKKVNSPHWMPIVDLTFDNGTIWHTTASQRYYNGTHFSYIDYQGKAVVFHGQPSKTICLRYAGREELVYDFAVDGTNVFFANDVAAEGYGD